jgi:predicted transcriptional regulator
MRHVRPARATIYRCSDKHIISFQVDSEFKAALQRLASAEDRSLSSYIKRLLKADVESKRQQKAGKKR